MEATEGTVTLEENGYSVENTLFTYSEDEMEENRKNKANAELVLKPKFIPLYPSMLQDLSLVEAVVFGFIDYFLSNNQRFYVSNDQIAKMLNTSEKTISLAVTSLKDKGLINTSYRTKKGGGKIRFIEKVDFTKCNVATLQNVTSYDITKCNGIYNNIIENNILYSFDNFWHDYPHARKGKKKDSETYFKQQHPLEVKKQVAILKWKIKAGLQDAQYVPACERWIRDFTPISEDVIKQDLMRICKWHLSCGGDIKQRAMELKETFGDQQINEIVKAIQQKDSPKNLFINK